MEPSHEWDVYVANEDEAYRARAGGMSCLECSTCRHPDDGGLADEIGWCPVLDEFVYRADTPEETECGRFE